MTTPAQQKYSFAFFGTSEFSVIILDELMSAGYVPTVIICSEDKPVGRKLIITPPPAKIWAEKNNIQVFQPKTLREEKDPTITQKIKDLSPDGFDFFIVASYGKIIPQTILDIPKHGTLNVHPSLLPKLRGASPIESAILTENETGVSIMVLDALMDHGPVIAQEKTPVPEWPPYFSDIESVLGHQGGKMLVTALPDWLSGKNLGIEQDHSLATTCGKISKEDAALNLSENPEINLRKIRAFNVWPKAYFFLEKDSVQIRIIITRARIENGELVLERVIPEGKKEMAYEDFNRGLKN